MALGSPAEMAIPHRTRPTSGPAGKRVLRPVGSDRRSVVGRRALIVIDTVLACLFLLAGIANFVLVDRMGIVGGISALAVGACAAVTACLFVVAGGWSAKETSEPRP